MKAIGAALVILALVIGIVPAFSDCQSQGRALELVSGKTIPMKCHWTGRAEIALAVPLAGIGLLLAFSRRRETRRALAAVGALLGLTAILLPVWLVGVCSAAEMVCNMAMKPVLILAGILVVVASAAGLVLSRGAEASP